MSKIGKKIITLPSGTTAVISGSQIVVKGAKGELKHAITDDVDVTVATEGIKVAPKPGTSSRSWGLQRALIANVVKGASQGFQKVLELNGVGYKATVKGSSLELSLGYTHPIIIEAAPEITFLVEKNVLTISGPDAQVVGQIAARIRAARPPEPYKGSGVKYKDEIIKRKAGKKAATAGAA